MDQVAYQQIKEFENPALKNSLQGLFNTPDTDKAAHRCVSTVSQLLYTVRLDRSAIGVEQRNTGTTGSPLAARVPGSAPLAQSRPDLCSTPGSRGDLGGQQSLPIIDGPPAIVRGPRGTCIVGGEKPKLLLPAVTWLHCMLNTSGGAGGGDAATAGRPPPSHHPPGGRTPSQCVVPPGHRTAIVAVIVSRTS